MTLVFISYATEDLPIAQAICAEVEAREISCWIAERDVRVGANWAESIAEALGSCNALILILSANANASKEVGKEVAIADKNGLHIFPVRIEDVEPKGPLAYHTGGRQWFEALSPRRGAQFKQLAASISAMLLTKSAPQRRELPSPVRSSRTGMIIAGILFALLSVGGVGYSVGYLGPSRAKTELEVQLLARLDTIVPTMPSQLRQRRVKTYVDARQNKAQAVSPLAGRAWRVTERTSEAVAQEAVLETCQMFDGEPCVLVAVNDRVLPTPQSKNWPRHDMPRLSLIHI